ncbi:type II secretion system protein GspE [Musicola paradisiaca]|uniref:Type II secretion system protein E n=1 Tax=Musicola paradisiaca (strain Ech703) TaxID=579405 RepID=C6C9M5_MUSP7|nr:type II secretion system protein GspE [Musicola paradisiaca]ACS84476.1 type II secretion system protein E [Musicola paradisiaca Ech703]
MTNNTLHHELSVICQRYQALLLAVDEQVMTVAVSGNVPEEMVVALRFTGNRRVLIEHWPAAKLEQRLSPTRAAETGEHYQAAPDVRDEPEDTPALRFINQILKLAVQRRASDIHFEPTPTRYRIRLRIDGVLQDSLSAPEELVPRITTRLKILGKLNIAERRLPQDGQFGLHLEQQRYSLRIATLPVHHGEKIVLRILHTQQQTLALEALGMTPSELQLIKQSLQLPQGMILVTGPTGSGKTFTLYSAIRWLNDSSRNICSVEDPVEIPLDGINQTAIAPKAHLDFSRVLRALLRQDPDIIMVGEIRDAETAEIAVKAAQTGHLVLSTLHTNSALDTLSRLKHLGIPGYLLASALKLIVAQRLVRRLCPHCRQRQEDSTGFPTTVWQGPLRRWAAKGCNHCFSGYYGRTAIYEMLPITQDIQHLLAQEPQRLSLPSLLASSGHVTLLSAGLALVDKGTTSLEEVYRVTGDGPC